MCLPLGVFFTVGLTYFYIKNILCLWINKSLLLLLNYDICWKENESSLHRSSLYQTKYYHDRLLSQNGLNPSLWKPNRALITQNPVSIIYDSTYKVLKKLNFNNKKKYIQVIYFYFYVWKWPLSSYFI